MQKSVADGASTRGYAINATWKYIDVNLPGARSQILEQIAPEIRAALGTYKEIEFYPIAHWSEVLRGIASLSNDDALAEQELEKCGEYIAHHATGTFLRLLMKVFTPRLFAKQLPSIWSRDNSRGRFDVDVTEVDEGRLVFRLTDAEGLDFVAPVAKGWIAFVMKGMGRPPQSMKLSGWSLAQPGAAEVEIDLRFAR